MFKSLVLALSFALALVAPVAAMTQPEAQALARWAGTDVPVSYAETAGTDVTAYFDVDWLGVDPHILLVLPERWPESWKQLVLFHEVRHAVQFRLGRLGDDAVVKELEADYYAVMAGCARGIQVSDWLAVWSWFRSEFGYDGDDSHGSLDDRLRMGTLQAPACAGHAEAPFVGTRG